MMFDPDHRQRSMLHRSGPWYRRAWRVVEVCGLVVVASFCASTWCCGVTSFFAFRVDRTPYPSPEKRYDAVLTCADGFLDTFSTPWIAEHGERDRTRWTRLGPTVDGSWSAHWTGPTELVLVTHERLEDAHPLQRWRDVTIAIRASSGRYEYAPDDRHVVQVVVDGRPPELRSSAVLRTTWDNSDLVGSCEIVPSGPWEIAARWRTSDEIVLRITPHDRETMPVVPLQWRGIRIHVEPVTDVVDVTPSGSNAGR